MEKNNDSYSIVYEFFEAENNDSIASGAIDLRSNRNRPMILSRRKFGQQTRYLWPGGSMATLLQVTDDKIATENQNLKIEI